MSHPVQEISRKIAAAFAANDTAPVRDLIADDARFVHMGITFTKKGELGVFDERIFLYRSAEVAEESLVDYGNTAIIYKRLVLTAEVAGHVAENPFVVTEVYTRTETGWLLSAETFTRIATDYDNYQLAADGLEI